MSGATVVRLAANYSPAAAALLRSGEIDLDSWKCPAWPDLIAVARGLLPVYVHLPLSVGHGDGDPLNTETGHPLDRAWLADLLKETGTPQVNVHLAIDQKDWAEDAAGEATLAEVARVAECAVRDLAPLLEHFGPERVEIENPGMQRAASLRPETIGRVIERTGCGLLLDLAHVRLAARRLGMDEQRYVEALPVEHLREVHVNGVQLYDEGRIARSRQAGVRPEQIAHYAGWWIDNATMTDDDWPLVEWMVERVRSGAWATPWVVTYECGGVGPWFDALTDTGDLAAQIPRLRALIAGLAGREGTA